MDEQRPLTDITNDPAFQTFCGALRDVTVRAALKAAAKKQWPFAGLTIRRRLDDWKKRVDAGPEAAALVVADFVIEYNSAVASLAENRGAGHWDARALTDQHLRDMLLLVEREPKLVFSLWLAFGTTLPKFGGEGHAEAPGDDHPDPDKA